MKKGQTLSGRYQLGDLLGSGTMGEVYAARDIDGAELAIKFLHPRLAALPEVRERFEREAIHARKIQSPHVARVVAAGPSGNRGKGFWIAYERLFGETLEERLGRHRSFVAGLAGSIFGQLLEGLSAAHAVGVVHRDIKPANVFLERPAETSTLRACILDFGVSKCRVPESSASSSGLTGTADTLGSIRYIAPEQIGAAAEADARADLYAAGVVLYRMLAGGIPFAGKSTATLLIAKLNDRALKLSDVTGVPWPDVVEGFFGRALARDPARRFPTAAEMHSVWRGLLASARFPDPQSFDPKVLREHDPEDFHAEAETHAGSTARG